MEHTLADMNAVSDTLVSKAEKARKAAQLGQHLKRIVKVPHEDAADLAHHELQHALKDKGPGKFGVAVENADEKRLSVTTFYRPEGSRTDEDLLEIVQAATNKPSESDKTMIKDLKKAIAAKKRKGFLAKIF